MKKIVALFLVCASTLSFPGFASEIALIRFSAENEDNTFQIVDNKSNAAVVGDLMCATNTELASFYTQPAEPVFVNNLDMIIRYKFMVECEASPSYVAIRHYGVEHQHEQL